MKKFKSLAYTLERLNNEIESKKQEANDLTAELNTLGDKVRKSRLALISLKEEIVDTEAISKAKIRKDNKDFVDKLNIKELTQKKTDKSQKTKHSELMRLEKDIEKREITISKKEIANNTKEKQLNASTLKVWRLNEELDNKIIDVDKLLEIKNKELSSIDNNLVSKWRELLKIVSEIKASKGKLDSDKQYIHSQKAHLLDIEKRIEKKQQKLNSDMRTLISAKNNK